MQLTLKEPTGNLGTNFTSTINVHAIGIGGNWIHAVGCIEILQYVASTTFCLSSWGYCLCAYGYSVLCSLEHVYVLLYWSLMSSEPVISCQSLSLIAISIYLHSRSIVKVFEKITNTNYASIDLTSSLDQILGLREPTFILFQQNKINLEPWRSVTDFLSVKKYAVNSMLLCLPILQRSCIRADQRLE